ncbi:simple sugar transport system ATP-binding protein [Deinococcus metalli]|uniref:Simple sugar transport system ATP-binding protein n=1 Tax=Deinococcus metalli TaxID=1141878 RepID=A0A7W8NN29_9DEIO|nr:ATP-binding cassette domain-containing protein [Deinococcus metalli]MBB5376444.1 simple sugar transport system ATP-binding protein [Deinococcus metalli]GHF43990.1 sugar ABC transporter ATP-binding protein [Deinococcus metalli]
MTHSSVQPPTPLLETRGITKRYGHVEALRGADFTVYPGEVVALLGDNGAGKSTLVKAITGTIQPDEGQVYFEGRPVQMTSPLDARSLGIETVFQDLALVPDMDPAANLFLGREVLRPGLLGRLGVIDRKVMRQRTIEAFTRLGVNIQDPQGKVLGMSGGQRQGVAVARAMVWASKMVLMDEPTAALGVVQSRHVNDLILRVKAQGVAVVLVSHNMQHVFEVADRIEVLRLGQRVAQFRKSETTIEDVVAAMTGLSIPGAA